MTDFDKNAIRNTTAAFIRDIIGMKSRDPNPLWLLAEAGVPDPVASILTGEVMTLMAARRGDLNQTCKKIIMGSKFLNTHIIKHLNAWGTSLKKLENVKKKHLHGYLLHLSTKHHLSELPFPTSAYLTPQELLFGGTHTPHQREAVPSKHIAPLLKLRHALIFGTWNAVKPCDLCSCQAQQTPVHILSTCNFPPIAITRAELIENAEHTHTIDLLSEERKDLLITALAGQKAGVGRRARHEMREAIFTIFSRLPFDY